MSPRVRKHLPALGAIAALCVLSAGVAFYILRHERLRLPFDPIYTVRVEMPTAQALTPGQGQSATVAGVRVGEVSKVDLSNGRALVELALDRRRLPQRDIKTDAHVLVRPRTPLQDMTVDITPGSATAPSLPAGATLDASHATPPVNFDEVLASLDTDTRAYLETLLQASGRAFGDRGQALREAFRAAAPTFTTADAVSRALNGRRVELARAVHNLRLLTTAVSQRDASVAQLLRGGSATFGALASETTALQDAIAQLPSTALAGERALSASEPLARAAAPALQALLPAARNLPRALRQTDPLLARGRRPVHALGVLARTAAPVLVDARPALDDLTAATPKLTVTFSVLRRLVNELAYVPSAPDHGYLFWAAWFAHNLNSFEGGQDANGGFWRGSTIVSCSSLVNQPLIVGLLGPALKQLAPICPQAQGAP